MRVEHYISELLYRYECVTIPGFGSFLTQHQSARIHRNTHAFYPPSKTLSFNARLTTNDGLLAKHISGITKKTYETVLEDLASLTRQWEQLLGVHEKLRLENIGELWLNQEGKLQFEPSYRINYLTSSFGLSSFVSQGIVREEIKKGVLKLEEKTPVFFTPEKKKVANDIPVQPSTEKHPYLKYAAIFLLALSTSLTGYKYLENQSSTATQVAVREAQKEVEDTIQQATFFDTSPLEIPSIDINVALEKKSELKYHVIGGAFRVEANALKKIRLLRAKGYKASHVGVNRYGLHQVAYSSFSDVNEALSFLRNVKTFENSEAWLWVDE